jgi:hypothetical protein
MITEDYVSFETAKLLKEKGFTEWCNSYFISDNEIALISVRRDFNDYGIYLSAPTLQMAMKWLRKAHNINIDIVPIWNQKRFEYQVFIITPENAKHCYVDEKLYLVYEQACEAAIKYSLKNLI